MSTNLKTGQALAGMALEILGPGPVRQNVINNQITDLVEEALDSLGDERAEEREEDYYRCVSAARNFAAAQQNGDNR